MSTQSSRSKGTPPPKRRRAAESAQLRCEKFEDRITPANLFNVQAPITNSSLNNNGFVLVTDLNKDGNADAILTNEGASFVSSGDKNIVVLYGHGNGTFTKATFATGAENVSFAAVADINGDGYPDLVTVSQNNAGDQSSTNQGVLSIFKNDGSGNLILMGSQSTDSVNPSWVGLADVTGDGVLDVVVGSFGPDDQTGQSVDGKITIFQGLADASGHGNFSFSTSPITVIQPDQTFIPTALAVGDFDGDGIMDIAAAVPQAAEDTGEVPPDGLIDIFKGTGAGGFSAQPVAQYDSGGINPVNIQLADVTGDHKADLIISNTGDASIATTSPDGQALWAQDGVEILPNTSTLGNPSFGVANSVVLSANLYGPFATSIADFNGDGKPDIAVVNYGGTSLVSSTPAPATVAIFQGNGNGTFTTTTPGTYNVGTKANGQPVLGGQYLAAGDFDNNGTQDLIVATADNVESGVNGSSAGLLLNASAPATPVKVSGIQINDGSAQRSELRSIQVTFSGAVLFAGGNINAAAAFQLTSLTDSNNVTLAAAVSTNGSGNTVVMLTFSGSETDPVSGQHGGQLSLADGRYQLTILSADVTGTNGVALDGDGNGTAGGNYVSVPDTLGGGTGQLGLYRLFGDATGNGVVDQLDLAQFRAANNSTGPGSPYVAYLDADNSGTIDQVDLAQFRARNNSSVFPSTPSGTPHVVTVPAPDSPVPALEPDPMPGGSSSPLAFRAPFAARFPIAALAPVSDAGNGMVQQSPGRSTDLVSRAGGLGSRSNTANTLVSLAGIHSMPVIAGGSVTGNGALTAATSGGTANGITPSAVQVAPLHSLGQLTEASALGTIDIANSEEVASGLDSAAGSSLYVSFLDADGSAT